MDAVVSILYWVKLAVLIVIVVLALWGAVRASRLRAFVAWRAVVQALLAIAAFAIFSWLAGWSTDRCGRPWRLSSASRTESSSGAAKARRGAAPRSA